MQVRNPNANTCRLLCPASHCGEPRKRTVLPGSSAALVLLERSVHVTVGLALRVVDEHRFEARIGKIMHMRDVD